MIFDKNYETHVVTPTWKSLNSDFRQDVTCISKWKWCFAKWHICSLNHFFIRWRLSGPCFPAFGLNTERYSISLRIQCECGEIRTGKIPNKDTFHAVLFGLEFLIYFDIFEHSAANAAEYSKVVGIFWSLLINEIAGLRLATLLENKLWHKGFPVNFSKFLKAPFLLNASIGFLLILYWEASKRMSELAPNGLVLAVASYSSNF